MLRAGLAQLGPGGAGLGHPRLWLWAVDVLGGLVAFAALGCAAIAWVHFVQPPSGPLIDLPALFDGLAARPADYLWLGVMLITTLVPPLLHLGLGVWALVLSPPQRVRAPIIRWLSAGNDRMSQRRLGTLAYCALTTAAICAPFWLGLLLWRLTHETILSAVIGGFSGFARAIGAL